MRFRNTTELEDVAITRAYDADPMLLEKITNIIDRLDLALIVAESRLGKANDCLRSQGLDTF